MSKVCSICGKGRLSGNKVQRERQDREGLCLHQVLEDDEQERRHRCRLSLFDKVQDAERRPFFMLFRRALRQKAFERSVQTRGGQGGKARLQA